jgi:mono/diheme cytochrome c family protein
MASISYRLRVLLAICSSLLFFSCTGKNSDSPHQGAAKDSTKLADSSGQVPPLQFVKSLTYEQRQGRGLYTKYCAICHGKEGQGDGFNAFNLDPKPRNFTDAKYMNALSDVRLVETINQGGKGVNRSSFMPSWGGRLNRQEIEYVVSFVRCLAKPDE